MNFFVFENVDTGTKEEIWQKKVLKLSSPEKE